MRSWIINFRPSSEILNDQKCRKVLLVLAYLVIHTHTFQPYLLHFTVKISIDDLLLEVTLCFWISKKLSFPSELESWLTKFRKMLSVLRHLDIPFCPSRKLHIRNFNQGLIWRWYRFNCLSYGEFSDFVPYTGILIGWPCENVQSIFLFGRFSV